MQIKISHPKVTGGPKKKKSNQPAAAAVEIKKLKKGEQRWRGTNQGDV